MEVNAFDSESIERAINKLKSYQIGIGEALENHIKELTEKGFEYMISIVKIESGELKNSISWEYDKINQKGTIKVGAEYAIFVEYGTGIVGANNPHPEMKEGWKYDVNSHGMHGWWYFDEKQNRYRWTRGQKANAFVYKTAEYIKNLAGAGIQVKLNG
jgi:hypothetical protein